jgi:integration host factor subunit beta
MRRVKAYTKKYLVERVFEKVQPNIVNIRQVNKVVNSTFMAIREIIIKSDAGSRIEIRSFGGFQIKKTNPKPHARNPKTGATISVPSHRKVHFKPGRIIQEELKKPIE